MRIGAQIPESGVRVHNNLPTRVGRRRLVAALVVMATTGPLTIRAQEATTGEAVITSMHHRFADSWYRTLKFSERTTRTIGDSTTTETWHEALLIPGHLRIDVMGANPARTIIYDGDSLFLIHGDSVQRHQQGNFLETIGFDVYRQSPEKTVADLKAEHFVMTPVRTDAWGGHEVYVIGARSGDLHSPQLWIDRDRFLFVRAFRPNAKDSTKTDEYRFDDYTLYPEGWLSRTVVFLTDGKVTMKEQYSNVQMDIKMDRSFFNRPR